MYFWFLATDTTINILLWLQAEEPVTYSRPEDQLMMKITGTDPSQVPPVHACTPHEVESTVRRDVDKGSDHRWLELQCVAL